ncbi:integral membrane protein [Viridothelium virens]|uniref:Integral membrane protein n=1 Tax=Viridothelium virens TaxID=1048519 RepID=A0A6A6GXP9_VIRVR|nr:integral membrane protein [Viridothelium virens]
MSQISTELVTLQHPESVAVRSAAQSVRSFGRTYFSNSSQPLAEGVGDGNEGQNDEPNLSRGTIASVIASVTLVAGLNSMTSGIITVGLPTIAADLKLSEELLIWPSAISPLTCGCTFLLSGSMVDVFGSRIMYLLGCFLQCVFVLGCGLSKTAVQLLICLGLGGISISLCLPSAVSLITNTLPTGKPRNLAFGSMGGSQPAGFAVGLVLGGILCDTIGWRYGFYICAAINAFVVVVAIFGLPKDSRPSMPTSWDRRWEVLSSDVDWIGALIACISLALMSYILASVTGNSASIREPLNASLLAIALALIPCFILWMGWRERCNKLPLIPNSLWKNRSFTTICFAVFLIWGSFNAAVILLSFFFQDVQLLTPIQTSIRFLPSVITGVLVNVIIGFVIHRIRANWIVFIAVAVTSLAPLLLALCNPSWTYWACAFLASCLLPAGADALFTISNLLITAAFPSETQGLAGGVFNTVSQIGKSVGLSLAQVIATRVTARSKYQDTSNPMARLEGYRASFWFCFAINVATLMISIWGLRTIGKVGHKRD